MLNMLQSGALKAAWSENPNRVRNGEFDGLTTLSYPDYSVHTGSHADPGCTVSNASGVLGYRGID